MPCSLASDYEIAGYVNLIRQFDQDREYFGSISKYFAVDQMRPGILKTWLLGKRRAPEN